MCNIRTISGASLRSDFTAFEINVFNFIFDNDIKEGETFPTTDMKGYEDKKAVMIGVLKNTSDRISFRRGDTSKILECLKKGAKVESTQPSPSPVPEPVKVAAVPTGDIKADLIAAFMEKQKKDQEAFLIQLAKANEPKEEKVATVDPELVKKLVAEGVKKEVEAIKEANTLHVQINDVPVVKVEGTLHPQFKKVLTCVSNRIPVYLHGPAGTGKTTLCAQVAKSLGVPFYCVSSLQQKYELEGFVNATGDYQATELYKAYTEGGVFLMDEIDNTAAEVLIAFNNALANGFYTFPKFGRVKMSPKCYFIAAGNTTGRGADEAYNGRYQLDASTLDRFAFVKVDYNKDIEVKMANGNLILVNFIHDLREVVKASELTYTVSPRAISRMVVFEASGMELKDCLKMAICGGWDLQDIKTLANNLKGNDKYAIAFKQL